jgi:hypothetical protein
MNINVDLDLDDLLWDLSKYEKVQLLEALKDDLNETYTPHTPYQGLRNDEWDYVCDKLASLYYRLKPEEEEAIRNILNKY